MKRADNTNEKWSNSPRCIVFSNVSYSLLGKLSSFYLLLSSGGGFNLFWATPVLAVSIMNNVTLGLILAPVGKIKNYTIL